MNTPRGRFKAIWPFYRVYAYLYAILHDFTVTTGTPETSENAHRSNDDDNCNAKQSFKVLAVLLDKLRQAVSCYTHHRARNSFAASRGR